MAGSKATRSGGRKKAYPRVLKFQQAKGKIVAKVELSVSADYYKIEILFQDKTALSFDLESCVRVFPELINWQSGDSESLKSWQPVRSRSSRV